MLLIISPYNNAMIMVNRKAAPRSSQLFNLKQGTQNPKYLCAICNFAGNCVLRFNSRFSFKRNYSQGNKQLCSRLLRLHKLNYMMLQSGLEGNQPQLLLNKCGFLTTNGGAVVLGCTKESICSKHLLISKTMWVAKI